MSSMITTSGEYVGGPYDGQPRAVELDTAGGPPTILTPTAGDEYHPDGTVAGGYYQVDGKTPAGRHRYVWVPVRRVPRPERKGRPCCVEPGRGCPMWEPS